MRHETGGYVIRETSTIAWRQIQQEGLLPKMRAETYRLLVLLGTATANQLMQKAQELNPGKTHQGVESIGRRLSELRDSGCVDELPKVTCPISGRLCYQWRVNGKLPKKPPKPKKIKCKSCNGRGYHIQESLFD